MVTRLCRLAPCLLAAALLVGACGQGKLVRTAGQVRDLTKVERYQEALEILRESKGQGFREQDRVVYWMNEGMLLHLLGRYKESSAVLEKCEQRVKELYTKSIRKQIKAVFTSDAAKDYAGEDYEDVLINVVKALNYLYLGDQPGALVEARKINAKLTLINTRYKDRKNLHGQDAFAHWLMGLLFELEGSFDDARIAYVKALEVYEKLYAKAFSMKVPPYLPEDAARAAVQSNASDEADRLRKKYGDPTLGKTALIMQQQGEVVLVLMNGEGPNKVDFFINCYVRSPKNYRCDAEPGEEYARRVRITIPASSMAVKMAIPQLAIHKPRHKYADLLVGDQSARTWLAEPVNEIAIKTLADKMHRVWRDTIIRAVTKGGSTSAAAGAGMAIGGKKLSGLFAKGASAAFQATEEADKRAWTTLPARWEVARVLVPPGSYAPKVRLVGGKTVTLPKIKVERGRRTIIRYKAMP